LVENETPVDSDKAGVDSESAESRLHLFENAPDFQAPVANHRHGVVVIAEVGGVGQLVRMRRVR